MHLNYLFFAGDMATFDLILYSSCVKKVVKDAGSVFLEHSRLNFDLLKDLVYNRVLADSIPRCRT